ncbi:hypothetical protein HYPSUDRAFT_40289 [Hypholoma sublateritium FD-334 SS-4]|uniref:Uncharacterized protein n=1 Tax=Hypholoma sublateritium (strain FD-334 SS-4) TaxID=945553 RepID=A0A0D2NWJ1_HYPSF|nr:hypothetical protein HYPSUDRAFT_40289 [Hypholoma sublateritium FD-334 SS-4]
MPRFCAGAAAGTVRSHAEAVAVQRRCGSARDWLCVARCANPLKYLPFKSSVARALSTDASESEGFGLESSGCQQGGRSATGSAGACSSVPARSGGTACAALAAAVDGYLVRG